MAHCYDHHIPVETSRLVVSSELFNQLKYVFTPEEFHRIIEELAAHHDGKTFDRDCIAFEHWNEKQKSPPEPSRRLHPEERTIAQVPECVICGRPPVKWSYYCPQCRRFVRMEPGDQRDRARAMKEAWSADEGGFLCRYTGARVDVDDPGSPWYLTFDHATSGDKGTLVVAAAWAENGSVKVFKNGNIIVLTLPLGRISTTPPGPLSYITKPIQPTIPMCTSSQKRGGS